MEVHFALGVTMKKIVQKSFKNLETRMIFHWWINPNCNQFLAFQTSLAHMRKAVIANDMGKTLKFAQETVASSSMVERSLIK